MGEEIFGLGRVVFTTRAGFLFIAATLAAVACGSSERSPAAPGGAGSAVLSPVIVALGDSLTAGPGLRPEETYPSLLQRRLRADGHPHVVRNAGVSGDTTGDALRRLDAALVERTRILIVALGANDGLRGIAVATVQSNLAAIIERAQARGISVLLCGIDTPPTRGLRYSVDFHNVFPELAARYGVPLVPFMLAGVLGNAELNLPDGIHPNAEGARIIAENLWPYLEPLVRATTATAPAR